MNVPLEVGVHARLAELEVAHPEGRPAYAYERVPVPPDAETARVVEAPTVRLEGVAAKLETTGIEPAEFTVRAVVEVAERDAESLT